MEIKEIHFIIVTFFAITLLCVLYENSSITGNIVKEAYCNELGCYSFCEKTSDCTSMEVCCSNENEQGICTYQENCEKLYNSKERNSAGLASFAIDKKYIDTFKKQEIYIYLLAGVAVIVILFLLFGKKHQTPEQKVEEEHKMMEKPKPTPNVHHYKKLPVIKHNSQSSIFRR